MSKAGGTPGALPDFIGLAFRVTPAQATGPWDILVVSSGSGALSRALALRPAISSSGQTLTTLMPLRYQGANWWLGARIMRLERDNIEVSLDQAYGRSDFTPLGRLTLTRLVDPERAPDVSFDPVVNTAPGLSLHPRWLADLRARAYRRSRHGRDTDWEVAVPKRARLQPIDRGRLDMAGAVRRHGSVVMVPAVRRSV